MTRVIGRRVAAILAAVALLASTATGLAATRIACVGDSLTFGANLDNPDVESYPAVLQTLLGTENYVVQNFGVNATTLLKSGDKPYWEVPAFSDSGTFAPDVVVLMLGTNDSKPINWTHSAEFSADYAAMIQHYRDVGAEVYVVLPPPVYEPGVYDITPSVLNDEIVPLIRQAATDAGAPTIDVFAALSGKPELFPDTVHPSAAADQLIAETVMAALPPPPPMDAGVASGGTSGDAAVTGGTGGSALPPRTKKASDPGGCSFENASQSSSGGGWGFVMVGFSFWVGRRFARRAGRQRAPRASV